MESMSLHFSVDMAFICDLARTQLWEEDRPMEDVLELLYSIMAGPAITDEQRYLLAIEILEGRKKIVGINEGTVVEDNELVRSISLLIQKKQRKIDYFELDRHMDVVPSWYVDTVVGGKSMTTLRDLTRDHLIQARQRIGFDNHKLPDHPLEWGCYLLTDPSLAFNILGGPARSHEEVIDKITIHWNKKLDMWKNEGLTYDTMSEFQKAVYDRNWFACGRKRRKDADEAHLYIHPFEDEIRSKIEKNAKWVSEQAKPGKYTETKDEHKKFVEFQNLEREGYKHHGQPDEPGEYYSEFAWISPEGLWYSASFGGHETKADNIVRERGDLIEAYNAFREDRLSKNFQDEEAKWRYEQKLPMFFLYESLHWAMLKDTYLSGSMQIDSMVELNDLQRAAIRSMVEARRLDHDPLTGEDINWDDIDCDDDYD